MIRMLLFGQLGQLLHGLVAGTRHGGAGGELRQQHLARLVTDDKCRN